jgi:hypothetical protein
MPSPEDLWNRLVEEAGEDAITDAASVEVTHAEQDLRAAGFDVKAEREQGSAWIASLTGETASTLEAEAPTAPPAALARAALEARRPPTSRRAVLIAVAVAVLAAGGSILYALGDRQLPTAPQPVAPPGSQKTPIPVPPPDRDNRVP